MQYKLFFLTRKPKNRNFWIFLCLLCVLSKFFGKQLFDVMLFSKKNFSWCLIPFEYLKNSPKKIFPKKKLYYRNFEEKNRKIWPIGRNQPNIFGDKNLCIMRIFCMNIFLIRTIIEFYRVFCNPAVYSGLHGSSIWRKKKKDTFLTNHWF